jgi:hypothetical protein
VIFGGECPICPELCNGHFGHARFKFFVIFNFDGHLVSVLFDMRLWASLVAFWGELRRIIRLLAFHDK